MTPRPKTPGGGGRRPGSGDGTMPGSGRRRSSTKVGKIDASDISKAQTSTDSFAKAGRAGGSSTPPGKGTTPPPTGGRTNIPKDKFDQIVATPKGSRPDPSTYMSQADIDAHLQPFRDTGAVRFTQRADFDQYNTIGPPGPTFAIPRSEFDAVMQRTGGDLGKVETELGLDPGTLTGGKTLIAYIKPENLNNLQMPNGNERGANPHWIPGGYTSGGVPEATIEVPAGTPFTEIKLGP